MLIPIDTLTQKGNRPEWLKAPAPVGENYHDLKRLVGDLKLHTVCESAACPNIGECWNHRTATFMILGNVCTRRCGFCNVQKGVPLEVDMDEPRRIAEAVEALQLRFAVVTSVNRDDRKDGGAEHFAMVIRAIRERVPACKAEVLVPDFQGRHASMDLVLDAGPIFSITIRRPSAALPACASGREFRAVARRCWRTRNSGGLISPQSPG